MFKDQAKLLRELGMLQSGVFVDAIFRHARLLTNGSAALHSGDRESAEPLSLMRRRAYGFVVLFRAWFACFGLV